jgi:hypothetical protein
MGWGGELDPIPQSFCDFEHEFSGFLVVLAGDESSGRIDIYQRFTAHEATRQFVEDAIREKLERTKAPRCPRCGSYKLSCINGHVWIIPSEAQSGVPNKD